MFSIVAQNRLRDGRFQVVDFDVQQVFDEWLCDVLIAENEPLDNRDFSDNCTSPNTKALKLG